MNKIYLLLIVFAFCFSSCDVWQVVQGRVLDSQTNQPINGVLVTIEDDNEFEKSITTDSTGYYNLLNKKNQAFKTSKNACTQIRFSHKDYETSDIKFCANKKESLIYLKRK